MTKIKICGITSLEDACAAVDVGADLLGFNFYRPSPRFIRAEQAKKIIDQIKSRSPEIEMVGVFVNESVASIVRTAEIVKLDHVQLHGDESSQFCEILKSKLAARQIIKALRVNGSFQPARASDYQVDAIMLDAFHNRLYGGTGETIDWEVARATRALVPKLFLSGGLSPENVADAIARVNPFAVDACSLLETSPGHKDVTRMKEFVRAARNA